jgi:tRNA-modifying protein YgfZ
VWEQARILCGLPKTGHELTNDVIAMEAGLAQAISLNKGCYIGQETLAKVTSTKGGDSPPGTQYIY